MCLALASQRIVLAMFGEDLGTVPMNLRERLMARRYAFLQVALFEKD